MLSVGAKDRGLTGTRIVSPSIMLPLTEMMEHALPKDHNDQVVEVIALSGPYSHSRVRKFHIARHSSLAGTDSVLWKRSLGI